MRFHEISFTTVGEFFTWVNIWIFERGKYNGRVAIVACSCLALVALLLMVLQKETGEGDRKFLKNQVIFIKTPEWDVAFKEEIFE